MSLSGTLKRYEQLSNNEMDDLLAGPRDVDSVYKHLVAYIKYRFAIADDDYWNDDIRELSLYSIKKILKLQRDEPLDELGMNCTGSASSAERKVLLLLSIRKKLAISITADESADIETVQQLAEFVAGKLANQDAAAGEAACARS